MTAALALPVVQGTPAWLDARRDGIGSSDLPILMGTTPYRSSPFDLWAVKTRLAEPAQPDEETQELWDLGHALEPVIAARYEAKTGRKVRRAPRMYQHPDIPWAFASLDRVTAPQRIVELKFQPHRSWRDGPEAVPADVQDQVQWQLFVRGWDLADVAVLSGGRVSVHEVPADRAYQDSLLAVATWFHDLVERREAPPVDGSEATRGAILRIHPREELPVAEPSLESDALLTELRAASRARRTMEAEDDRLRNVLRLWLGERAGVESDWYRVDFVKREASARVDWKDVAAAYRRLLDGRVSADELDALESLHSMPLEGSRPLSVRFKDEQGKWGWV